MKLRPSGSARVYLESGWSAEFQEASCSPCSLDVGETCALAVEGTSTGSHRGILL